MFMFDRLDCLRKEAGKSKTYLCELVQKPNYYLRDIQKDGTVPPIEFIKIWADNLNTTPEYLMGESDQKEKATGIAADSYKAKLLQLAQDLDEEKAAKMLEMAKVMFGK